MFERFTERARQVIVLAQEEARARNHDWIGGEHLLMGLLREEEGLASRALQNFDLDPADIDFFMAPTLGPQITGQIPFTPNCKKAIELSMREALALGHNYIGTEHVLLGLLNANLKVIEDILDRKNLNPEQIKNEVHRMLRGKVEKYSPEAGRSWDKTEEDKLRDQVRALKKEVEDLKQNGQSDSEQESKKVAATITYGDSTLKIEGNGSGLANTLIKALSESLLKK